MWNWLAKSLYVIVQLLRPNYKQIAQNQNAEIFSANTLLVISRTNLLTARVSYTIFDFLFSTFFDIIFAGSPKCLHDPSFIFFWLKLFCTRIFLLIWNTSCHWLHGTGCVPLYIKLAWSYLFFICFWTIFAMNWQTQKLKVKFDRLMEICDTDGQGGTNSVVYATGRTFHVIGCIFNGLASGRNIVFPASWIRYCFLPWPSISPFLRDGMILMACFTCRFRDFLLYNQDIITLTGTMLDVVIMKLSLHNVLI